jgi:hypothetical protein
MMPAALALAHELTFHRKELWNAERCRELARAALKERDELVLRVAELELKTRAIPRFQGMTELA